MSRLFGSTLIALVLMTALVHAQEGIQRGKVHKVDADKGTVTLLVDGKQLDCTVTAETQMVDAGNRAITDGLKDPAFKTGAAVAFKAESRDGKNVLVGLRFLGDSAPGVGGGEIQKAKLKKINLDEKMVTLTVDGKDRDFLVIEQTQLFDAPGKDLRERLQGFKEGAEVLFKAAKKDGKDILVGMKLLGAGQPKQPKVDTGHLKPLAELGTAKYQGYQGGFYPDGKNDRPAAHEAAGLALAKEVRPLDANGKPSADGKIVLLSVGMSNTSQASGGFQQAMRGAGELNPHLVFVNGAQGGMTASAIQDPNDNGRGAKYWTTVDERLKAAKLTREQVQVVWIKQADAGPKEGFPDYAKKLQAELTKIVQLLPARFPNVKMVYLSSRTYGGYATTPLNPEPYAFESGFSVKWLIEQQINGEPALNYDPKKGAVKAPWLSWGAYLWANGTTKRADGFFYDVTDYGGDGTHPSAAGVEKIGRLLLEFFKTDSTTRPWFVGQGAGKTSAR